MLPLTIRSPVPATLGEPPLPMIKPPPTVNEPFDGKS
jgi:hypothetical protein